MFLTKHEICVSAEPRGYQDLVISKESLVILVKKEELFDTRFLNYSVMLTLFIESTMVYVDDISEKNFDFYFNEVTGTMA